MTYFRKDVVETYKKWSDTRIDVTNIVVDEKAKGRDTGETRQKSVALEMGNGAETIRDSITIRSDRRSNTIHRPAINTEKWVISHLELRAAWEEE